MIVGLGLAVAAPRSASGQACPDRWGIGPRISSAADGVRIVAVGDVMLGTSFPDSSYLDPRIVPGVRVEELVGPDLVRVLRSGEVLFGNLEGTLFDGHGESKRCRNMDLCYAFRSPEWYSGLLSDMGFNLMSLANNHSGDFLAAGREATVAALDRQGIVVAGLAESAHPTGSLELGDGTLIGLAAFSPNKGTVSIHDLPGMKQLVAELKRTHDLVIVSFHGGAEGADRMHVTREPEEFYGERRGNVFEFARGAIDAGADLVLGHGPHVPRAVEIYRDRLIVYSLGNFWTWGRFNLRGPNGLAPILEVELQRHGAVAAARIHSARQTGLGSPRLDRQGRAARLMGELTLEDFPESEVSIDSEGRIVRGGASGGERNEANRSE